MPPLPAGPIGLQSDKAFTTAGAWTDGWGTVAAEADAVRICYSAADNRYTVKLPEYQEGQLAPKSASGSYGPNGWIELQSTTSAVTLGTGPATQLVDVTLAWPASSQFTYTSFGSWFGPGSMGDIQGLFAYGPDGGGRRACQRQRELCRAAKRPYERRAQRVRCDRPRPGRVRVGVPLVQFRHGHAHRKHEA